MSLCNSPAPCSPPHIARIRASRSLCSSRRCALPPNSRSALLLDQGRRHHHVAHLRLSTGVVRRPLDLTSEIHSIPWVGPPSCAYYRTYGDLRAVYDLRCAVVLRDGRNETQGIRPYALCQVSRVCQVFGCAKRFPSLPPCVLQVFIKTDQPPKSKPKINRLLRHMTLSVRRLYVL